MKQTQINLYPTCIFDHFIIPDNDDWIYKLIEKKYDADKRYNLFKKIVFKNIEKSQ